MRTINVRDIWAVDIEWGENGSFTLGVRHAQGPNREPHKVVLHFDSFFWVKRMAGGLWTLVTKRREQLEQEVSNTEKAMRGDK